VFQKETAYIKVYCWLYNTREAILIPKFSIILLMFLTQTKT